MAVIGFLYVPIWQQLGGAAGRKHGEPAGKVVGQPVDLTLQRHKRIIAARDNAIAADRHE
jgi:hypothetical protein